MSGSNAGPAIGLVTTLQIVVAAMTAGCVLFLIIALVITGGVGNAPDLPVVTYAAVGIAVVVVVARLIVPGIVAAQARRKILAGTWKTGQGSLSVVATEFGEQDSEARKFAQVFAARTILAAALLEGAVFLLLVAYLVEHSPLSLALAVALLAALAAHIPTQSCVDAWIQEQTRLFSEERSF